MFNLSFSEIALTLLLALIFLGPKNMLKLAHKSGQLLAKLKKAYHKLQEEINN